MDLVEIIEEAVKQQVQHTPTDENRVLINNTFLHAIGSFYNLLTTTRNDLKVIRARKFNPHSPVDAYGMKNILLQLKPMLVALATEIGTIIEELDKLT